MLFNKSILSFVAALALAATVSGAATGQQANNNNNQVANPNQDTTTTNNNNNNSGQTTTGPPVCSTGTPTCCDSQESFYSLSADFQAALKSLDSNVNPNLSVGVNCNAAGSQTCPTLGLCCEPVQNQDGLPNVAANCASP